MMIAILTMVAAIANAATGYDEAYTSRGLRPAYRELWRFDGVDVLVPSAQITEFMMGSPLGDSQKAWPTPLVLTHAENRRISAAVARRAEVYRQLFHDLVMGDRRVYAILTPGEQATVEQAFRDSGLALEYLRSVYRGMPLSAVRFLYGPDLVRNASGRWVVLEDNIGESPGGLVDGDILRNEYVSRTGLNFPKYGFLSEAARSFLEDLGGTTNAAMAFMTHHPPRLTHSDDERRRIMANFIDLGIATARTDPDGNEVMLYGGDKKYLFVMDDPSRYSALNVVRLTRAAAKGRWQFFITPGVEALSSKAFLPLVDRFARFYFNETLVLRSPPTRAIRDDADVARAIDKWGARQVIKENLGRAGEQVYFLHKMNDEQREALITKVYDLNAVNLLQTGYPTTTMITQPFVESSRLTFGGHQDRWVARIDIRPLTYVGPHRTVVSAYPWGRASGPFGSLHHNVSLGAQHLVVLVNCETSLVTVQPGSQPQM